MPTAMVGASKLQLKSIFAIAACLGSVAPGLAATLGTERPKVATTYFGGIGNADELREVARFDFVVLHLYGRTERMQRVIETLRTANPQVRLATYTVLVELRPRADPNDPKNFPALQAVNSNDWWAKNSAGQRVQWTQKYGTDLVNITRWTSPNEKGQRWPQWLAAHHASLLRDLSGLDYIYVDNVWHQPRGPAVDWKRSGTDQAKTDPEIQSAYRQGTADYWAALRNDLPEKKIIGNADNDLGFPEFKGKIEGALLECQMGKTWSNERRGWDRMMAVYRNALANTLPPKDVVFQVCSPDGQPDLKLMRYGLTSALLEDGWFAYKVTGARPPFLADEYSAPIGRADEAPPVKPASSGVWTRRYSNGLVLVNPTNKSIIIDVGPGYQRLSGKQDPVTNNGLPVRTITLESKDGLILLKK